jgi:hypothetical protein
VKDENGLPLEDFIQALTSQLDRAQTTMALKARAGLPLTFAVKDLKLDLRTHVQVVRNAVHIRPAGPGDSDASTLRLELTTITRPMIEENTLQTTASQAAEPTIEEFVKENTGQEITEEDQRRLEWGGVHTIAQLRQLERTGGTGALRRIAGSTPVERLRAALMKTDSPRIETIRREARPAINGVRRNLMRIAGRNLMQGGAPEVTIDGQTARVLEARPDELLIERTADSASGTIALTTAPGLEMALAFELDEAPAAAAEGANG